MSLLEATLTIGREILEFHQSILHVCRLAIKRKSIPRPCFLRLDSRSIRCFVLYLILGLDHRLESIQSRIQGSKAGSRISKQELVLLRHGLQCRNPFRLDLVYTPCWGIHQSPKFLLCPSRDASTMDLELLYVPRFASPMILADI